MSASGDNGDEGEFATGLKEMSESPSVLTFRKATMLTASYFPTFDQSQKSLQISGGELSLMFWVSYRGTSLDSMMVLETRDRDHSVFPDYLLNTPTYLSSLVPMFHFYSVHYLELDYLFIWLFDYHFLFFPGYELQEGRGFSLHTWHVEESWAHLFSIKYALIVKSMFFQVSCILFYWSIY